MQQLNLFESEEGSFDWCSDDWETPDWLATAISRFVTPTDRVILEPSAGTGQIAKHLKKFPKQKVYCIEPNRPRYNQGKKIPKTTWVNFHFQDTKLSADLIISNPPFSGIQEFIEHGLSLLKQDNPEARIVFLLPLDWMCPVYIQRWWRNINAHIEACYQIPYRVAYLKNGTPHSGRMRYDAIFDIRPGKDGGCMKYLW